MSHQEKNKSCGNSCSLDQGVHEMRNRFEEWRGNEVQKHVGIYQYECRCAYTSMLIWFQNMSQQIRRNMQTNDVFVHL